MVRSKIITSPSYDSLIDIDIHIDTLTLHFSHPPILIYLKIARIRLPIYKFLHAEELFYLYSAEPILDHIPLNRYLCYDTSLSFEKKMSPIGFKQSYFFEHEEIKKPLQLPEILGLLKAQK